MPQSVLELIFKTLQQGQGGKQAAADLKELKGTVGELSQGFLGFNAASLTAVGAITAVGAAVGVAITDYQDYAEQIRGLAAITGTGAEETSRMVQAFDDLGISAETTASVMSTAARKGFVATTDNIGKLMDEYNRLNTQSEKNALLNERLGKGGFELAKAFEAGSQAFREAADSQGDAMLVTEQDAIAAEKLRVAQDTLNDSVQSLKNSVAKALIPALADLAQHYNAQVKATQMMEGVQMSYQARMNQTAILTEALVNAQNDQVQEQGLVAVAMEAGAKKADLLTFSLKSVGEGMAGIPGPADMYIQKMNEMAAADERLAKQLTTDMQAYSNQLLFQISTEGLSAENKLKVAEALGLVDAHTKAAREAAEIYRKEFENGTITAEEYAKRLGGIAEILGGINSKTVDIIINIKTIYTYQGSSGAGQSYGGGYVDPGTGSKYGSNSVGASAVGASTQAAASGVQIGPVYVGDTLSYQALVSKLSYTLPRMLKKT